MRLRTWRSLSKVDRHQETGELLGYVAKFLIVCRLSEVNKIEVSMLDKRDL